jgi:hypothetical protein
MKKNKKIDNLMYCVCLLIPFLIIISLLTFSKAYAKYNVSYYCKDAYVKDKECYNCFTFQNGKEKYVNTVCHPSS